MEYQKEDNVSVSAYEASDPQPLRVTNGIPMDSEYATVDDLFAETKPYVEEVWLPRKKKKVYVRSISAKERDAYEQSLVLGKGQNASINMRNARAKLAVLALANSDGTRMLKDADAGRLGDLDAIDIQAVFDRARKVNGFSEEDMIELTGN